MGLYPSQIAKQAQQTGVAATVDGGRPSKTHACLHQAGAGCCVYVVSTAYIHIPFPDFLAQGQPFGKLSGEVQAALAGIAQQRLFSLGWVLTTHDWME
jgi:hypothetical protein